MDEYISKYRLMSYFSLLMIICLLAFLTAKYIVRSAIYGEQIPVDTSTRM